MTGLGVALLGLSTSVQAIPLTGQITMSGAAFLNSAYNTTTALTGVGAFVEGAPFTTGSFTPLIGDVPTFPVPQDVTVGPKGATLWIDGAVSYVDTLVTKLTPSTDAGQWYLNIGGFGYFDVGGNDSSIGSWSETLTGQVGQNYGTYGGVFYTQIVGVPDGGTTVGLLGLGLAACALYTRKTTKLA